MERFVNTIISIIAQEIFTILFIDMRLNFKELKFVTSEKITGPASLADYFRTLLDTSKGTKINGVNYVYKTNFGHPEEAPKPFRSRIDINICPFRYFPRP